MHRVLMRSGSGVSLFQETKEEFDIWNDVYLAVSRSFGLERRRTFRFPCYISFFRKGRVLLVTTSSKAVRSSRDLHQAPAH